MVQSILVSIYSENTFSLVCVGACVHTRLYLHCAIQILEELQKVERELQEKAQAQLIINARDAQQQQQQQQQQQSGENDVQIHRGLQLTFVDEHLFL